MQTTFVARGFLYCGDDALQVPEIKSKRRTNIYTQIWISDIRTQLQLHMYENVRLTTVNCVEGLHIILCRPTEMEYFEVNQLKQSTQAIVWSFRCRSSCSVFFMKQCNMVTDLNYIGYWQVNISTFALLFSEMVQYCQNRVNTVPELQAKYVSWVCRMPISVFFAVVLPLLCHRSLLVPSFGWFNMDTDPVEVFSHESGAVMAQRRWWSCFEPACAKCLPLPPKKQCRLSWVALVKKLEGNQ